MELRFWDDAETGLPHTYDHGVTEEEVHEVLSRSEEHTSELQSHSDLVCRLLLEKKKAQKDKTDATKASIALIHPSKTNPILTEHTKLTVCSGSNDNIAIHRLACQVTYLHIARLV